MREIKFRAKANINDEWIYASNIHKVILDDINEKLWVMHPKGEKIKHLGNGYIKYRPLVVDEETIGQYTGLKDKNETEIYEGDIVDDSETELIYVIEFICGEFVGINEECGIGRIMNSLSEDGEVIGNIHDNPELLEREGN